MGSRASGASLDASIGGPTKPTPLHSQTTVAATTHDGEPRHRPSRHSQRFRWRTGLATPPASASAARAPAHEAKDRLIRGTVVITTASAVNRCALLFASPKNISDQMKSPYQHRLARLISKRSDRPYRGRRSPHWIKVKNRKHPAMKPVKEFRSPTRLHLNLDLIISGHRRCGRGCPSRMA